MMSLKLTICSWILLFVIFSNEANAVETYKGLLIDFNDARHPDKVCLKSLDTNYGIWASGEFENMCSTNITCLIAEKDELVTLSVLPETGVICHLHEQYACYNKKCTLISVLGEEENAKNYYKVH